MLYGEDGADRLFGGWGDAVDQLFGGGDIDRFLQPRYQINLTVIDEDQIKDYAANEARIYFAWLEKGWTDEEVESIDVGLDWLHHLTGGNRLLRMPDRVTELQFNRVYGLSDDGLGLLATNSGGGMINFADMAFLPGIGTDETVVHEIGHNWDDQFDALFFAGLSDWKLWNVAEYGIPAGYMQANRFGTLQWYDVDETWAWIYSSNAEFSRSDNYGQTNPREDFATCLETYYALTDPLSGANPKSNWLSKWNYINDWIARMRG
jgi:hypothetical protein